MSAVVNSNLVVAGAFPPDRVPDAWRSASAIPITFHPLNPYGPEAVAMAQRLRRQSTCDAAYLARAERLGAELWTFDGPLARNATTFGLPVHLVNHPVTPGDE